MAKQKPPDSIGKLTGFPYRDLWEQFGKPWDRLHIDGQSREMPLGLLGNMIWRIYRVAAALRK